VTLPIMISGTITDLSGARSRARPRRVLALGPPRRSVLGRAQLRARAPRDAGAHPGDREGADTLVCAYPNAGLPNEFGLYDERPEATASMLASSRMRARQLVGGCCGTTPEHIRAIAEAVAGKAPRAGPELEPQMRLSGSSRSCSRRTFPS
jgi:5-methyltetrahydrofolate--homocysteine methyltransferase